MREDSIPGERPCPHCGLPVKAAAKLCKHCKKSIDATVQPLRLSVPESMGLGAAAASVVAPTTRTTDLSGDGKARRPCPFCQEIILANAERCSVCGERVGPDTALAPSAPMPTKKGPVGAPSLALLTPGDVKAGSYKAAMARLRLTGAITDLERAKARLAGPLGDALWVVGAQLSGEPAATERQPPDSEAARQMAQAQARWAPLTEARRSAAQRVQMLVAEANQVAAAQDIHAARRRLELAGLQDAGQREVNRLDMELNALQLAIGQLQQQLRQEQLGRQRELSAERAATIAAARSFLLEGRRSDVDAALVDRAKVALAEDERLTQEIEKTRAVLATVPPASLLALVTGAVLCLPSGLALVIGLLTDAGDSLTFEWFGLAAIGGVLLVPPTRWYAAFLRFGAAGFGGITWALLGESLWRVVRASAWDSNPGSFNAPAAVLVSAVLVGVLVLIVWKVGLGIPLVGIGYAAVALLFIMLQSSHLLQKAETQRAAAQQESAKRDAENRARAAAELQDATDHLATWVARADSTLRTEKWRDVRSMVTVMEKAAPNSGEVARVRAALSRREADVEREQRAERARDDARERAGPCIENCEDRCRDKIQGCMLQYSVEFCREVAQAVQVCVDYCPSICGAQ